ncbi:MTHFR-domain-containing protein [Sporormia fimetaria CBS 119925]|uniref:MTHFR-domain-containing protein n=1 Tax=Sporormia fimetaria CBS 119925 TaxID=1340428 RepID=A0A6A6V5G5_9PLEO|nr:MTHFR-domain-containing protein [Sporormia fimetaria CBS 119925]
MEKITDKINALPDGAEYFSLEFFPPKTATGFHNLQERLERMTQALRPLFVTVTWGAGGSTASKSLELAELCQRQLGLTTCLHLTCTNMNRSLIDEALEQAKVLGIRNILALRGDAPRSDEYRDESQPPEQDSNKDFTYAADLVRYIRKQYGDYFCIGVAAYPEGHSDESHPEHQDPLADLPYLVEKTKAGADFILTQLFFDVGAYDRFEKMLREHESGVFKTIPIIAGLMPIQSYQILRRTTKLSHASLPVDLLERLDAVRGDDELVKKVGVQIISEIVDHIKRRPGASKKGFHFYTLNLEKAVSHILEDCRLIPLAYSTDTEAVDTSFDVGDLLPPEGALSRVRRRLSSVGSSPHNRFIVSHPSQSSSHGFETSDHEAGLLSAAINTRAHTLAISEGEGSLGREAVWDDFPNGRWGDARSPAFGEIDGYGPTLHVSTPQALKLWGHPVEVSDISAVFRRHIEGELEALPWSEEGLSPETSTISKELLAMNAKGWWTVASQPAVNGAKSDDPVFGWGPKNGRVFQKPFVEFFIPSADWKKLKPKLDAHEQVTYFAGNEAGDFEATDEESVNPVTWGSFVAKEIVTPTIIEAVSFRSWMDEAYNIWKEWQRIYPSKGRTSQLLEEVRKDVWLVNVIWGDFLDPNGLWELLLE